MLNRIPSPGRNLVTLFVIIALVIPTNLMTNNIVSAKPKPRKKVQRDIIFPFPIMCFMAKATVGAIKALPPDQNGNIILRSSISINCSPGNSTTGCEYVIDILFYKLQPNGFYGFISEHCDNLVANCGQNGTYNYDVNGIENLGPGSFIAVVTIYQGVCGNVGSSLATNWGILNL